MSGISYTTVLGTAGTIGTTLTVITLWIWKRTTKLDGKEDERIQKLSEEEVHRVSEELAKLFIEVEGGLGRYRIRGEEIQSIIKDNFTERKLTNLVESHSKVGESLHLYNKHKEEYENAYGYFGYASIFILSDILLVVSFLLGLLPLGRRDFQYWALIPALSAIPLVIFGVNSVRKARKLKKKFNERWQEHRYN